MITRAYTVCFEGIEPKVIDVECAITNGLPAFSIVGLPDKAVSEARERIRAAFAALSIALPSKRITSRTVDPPNFRDKFRAKILTVSSETCNSSAISRRV